jgi:hypothetical protein
MGDTIVKRCAASRSANNDELKKGTFVLLCILGALWMICHGYDMLKYPEHPRGAVCSQSGIAQRALKIGIALGGSARLMQPPLLQTDVSLGARQLARRKVWVVLCEAGTQQMNMVFDDKSGRLVFMNMESYSNKYSFNQLTSPINTEKEAVSVAVDRMKRLEILPQGSLIALRERPGQIYNKSMWELNWLVRLPENLKTYSIKLILNRATGRPSYMVDLSQRI